jgi:hypothetical protein
VSSDGASNGHPGGRAVGKEAGRLFDVRLVFADEDPPPVEPRELPPAVEDALLIVKGDRRFDTAESRHAFALVVSIFGERQVKRSQKERDRLNITKEVNAIVRDPRFKHYLEDCALTGQKPISKSGIRRAITMSLQ